MNSFIKIFSVLCVISPVYSLTQNCEAHLSVECDIANVNYFVDDSLAGNGNKLEINLSKGIHRFVAMENSDRWDSKTFIDTLQVNDCQDIFLQYTFRDKILLNTDPQDAYVYSSDSLIGYTPLLISNSLKNLKLEKPGFESRNINYADFEHKKPVILKFTGEKSEEQFFDKDLFKILTGSMILLGATTAYFKLKADNRFEDYQNTGNKDLLDETNRFDLISGITFGALQINFGAII